MGLAATARRVPDHTTRIGSRAAVATGVSLAAFGWAYPHFLATSHWTTYLVAAPLGLLPCPTLAGVIGVTIAWRGLDSTPWRVTLGLVGLAYGMIGIFGLGVTLDVGLAAGASVLLLSQFRQINRRLAISVGGIERDRRASLTP